MADAPFVSLYRRFRPGRFDELVGQEHVVRALRSAVRDDRVSHTYLFSGPRGTGKTSSARILAKALNCEAPVDGEPCGTCLSCREITQGTSLNVHELDAASNNGVESMRDLVSHAGLGTPGRWKVYIVDEVHMLSTAAANALLKTLEEPPGHVVFVLATTDPQKVPPTIRSRTQHLEFRLLGSDTLHDLLHSVNDAASLGIGADIVEVAVRRGRGSARDALSALDQLVASGSADAGRPELGSVLAALSEGEAPDVLVALSGLLASGWGPQQLATELVDDLRQVFLAALAPELCAIPGASRDRFSAWAASMGLAKVVRTMELLGRGLVDMRDAPDPQVILEIAMVRASRPDLDAGTEALAERVGALERQLAGAPPVVTRPEAARPAAVSAPPDVSPAPQPEPIEDVGRRPSVGAVRRRQASSDPDRIPRPIHAVDDTPTPEPEPELAPILTPDAPKATVNGSGPIDRDTLTQAWGDGVLRMLPLKVKALYSSGRFVAVDAEGAHFALPNAAHRDRCAESARDVESALAQHFGSPVRLVLEVDGAAAAPATARPRTTTQAASPPPEPDDAFEIDPEEFNTTSTPDTEATAAEARLLEAFPGASEVTE